ncbi:biotin--[acetyl-CoA-carboxylase] ligase [Marispirochaeta sp.]|jgi:BirA family transcriptional regulator, biotin operon repressor / biotin---[acetyl-CoA-carboxylase] ligase|uniref:biotin--[acetyl-CoA-carboxylase] ligase n=1 Tax=Marispirochaeta sp. TaxID=2038653 RepID=UPI0029C94576|nr:biotin--[acetyl-CoA-carboxylase] ligase [Marispirochaeta sp.]
MLTTILKMVNVKRSLRAAVLEILRSAHEPISGTQTGIRLGISRVAVRKHIHKLMEEGFSIETRKRGYLLISEPDYPAPSEYDSRQVHILGEVESTMEEACHSSSRPQEGIHFYVARRQRSGRGRNKKSWVSPEGGLYVTAIFKPRLPAAYCSLYVLHTGLYLCESLRHLFSVNCSFRWPNDICIKEKKLGGILLEISGPSESPDRALIGVGLNIRSRREFTRVKDRTVTSLQAEVAGYSGENLSPKYLFSQLKPAIESSLGKIKPEELRKRWNTETDAIGGSIAVNGADYTVCGLALNGSLVAADSNGQLFEIAPGLKIMGPV